MIEQLRIQCPSCGIILDVRNSKHEAVKRITCPHCQKQLAVDFRDEVSQAPAKPLGVLYYGEMRIDLQEGVNQIPLPACDALEIKAVRLNDGNSKCLVRALNDQQPVLLNGEPLGKDDEVALSIGDELRIGNTILTFGQQGKVLSQEPKPEPKLVEKAKGTRSSQSLQGPYSYSPVGHRRHYDGGCLTGCLAVMAFQRKARSISRSKDHHCRQYQERYYSEKSRDS